MASHTRNHTFVIPAYKEPEYIDECIVSLKNQTVASDIIIATSTPSAFLKGVADNHGIPLIVNPNQEGIAADWSFACNGCDTDYVTLAHQDDIYLPTYTERCIALSKQHPDSLITFTDYTEWYQDGIRDNTPLLRIKRLILKPFYTVTDSVMSPFLKKALLSVGSPICCPSVMFNRSAIGTIEFNRNFSINMDWDFWLTLARRPGSFNYVNDKLMIHRIHDASETSAGLINNKRQSEDRRLFEVIWPKAIAVVLSRAYSLSYISNG